MTAGQTPNRRFSRCAHAAWLALLICCQARTTTAEAPLVSLTPAWSVRPHVCRLHDVPDNAQVRVIAVDWGDVRAEPWPGLGEREEADLVQIQVGLTQEPIVLVLIGWRATRWQVSQSKNANIIGIVVTGLAIANTDDIPLNIPLIVSTGHFRECRFGYTSTGKMRKPDEQIEQLVIEATGRPLDTYESHRDVRSPIIVGAPDIAP